MSRVNGGYGEGESWQTGSSVKQGNMELFVEWLLLPESKREPRTRNEFADRLGVTTQTLRNYEKESFVVNALASRRRQAFKVADLDNVIRTLVGRATDPDAGAAGNTAAKILLDWADTQTAEMNAEQLREMSDAELKQMLIQAYDRIDG